MSDENTAYYIAAGRSLKAVQKWVAGVDAVHEARRAFLKQMKAKGFWMTSDSVHVLGLTYPGPGRSSVPVGLRPSKKLQANSVFFPNLRRKKGRQIQRQLEDLAEPKNFGGSYYIDRDVTPGSPHILSTPGIRQVGSKWVISQHEKAEPPADAIALTRSEFWRIVEKQEAEEAAAEPVNA